MWRQRLKAQSYPSISITVAAAELQVGTMALTRRAIPTRMIREKKANEWIRRGESISGKKLLTCSSWTWGKSITFRKTGQNIVITVLKSIFLAHAVYRRTKRSEGELWRIAPELITRGGPTAEVVVVLQGEKRQTKSISCARRASCAREES